MLSPEVQSSFDDMSHNLSALDSVCFEEKYTYQIRIMEQRCGQVLDLFFPPISDGGDTKPKIEIQFIIQS